MHVKIINLSNVYLLSLDFRTKKIRIKVTADQIHKTKMEALFHRTVSGNKPIDDEDDTDDIPKQQIIRDDVKQPIIETITDESNINDTPKKPSSNTTNDENDDIINNKIESTPLSNGVATNSDNIDEDKKLNDNDNDNAPDVIQQENTINDTNSIENNNTLNEKENDNDNDKSKTPPSDDKLEENNVHECYNCGHQGNWESDAWTKETNNDNNNDDQHQHTKRTPEPVVETESTAHKDAEPQSQSQSQSQSPSKSQSPEQSELQQESNKSVDDKGEKLWLL